MSYGGGYGRARNGYGDSNGHTNGYALCDVYSTSVLLSASAPRGLERSGHSFLQRSDRRESRVAQIASRLLLLSVEWLTSLCNLILDLFLLNMMAD